MRSHSAATGSDAPPSSAAASSLSPHQWSDVVQYLTADELKELRLAGSKEMHLADPCLTSHLQLRMDKAPFFSAANNSTLSQAKKWLTNRRRLVVNHAVPKMCPYRVAYLVANGLLDSVSQIVIFDCHAHRRVFALLAQLPNLESLRLASHASDQEEGAMDELEFIVASVGRVHSLKHLDIEFDCVIPGSRLSFLRGLQGLQHLRLRGFDLSDGIRSMGGLRDLKTLHLCHGNFYSSPSNDVNEKDLINLLSLTNVNQVHLEGFDCLSETGLKPFSTTPASVKRLVLKHCQDLNDDCLPSIGRMENLTSLHFVHSAYDEVPIFDIESLHHINALVALKSLSLFYVLEDPTDLRALWGLTSLETLNIALEDELDEEDVDYLRQNILPMFGSLRKLRIFSEESMCCTCRHGKLEIEYAPFTFGDLVYLE
eukprot:CAMPEP_0172298136 /NCGR_PEP_ID=MMETSP1058-20130122/916_1 /TAXON_ID=83371 /ORGANISM="Detonula confervacea, Strain CCMP 353" /LENGTH=426 /DNA_ID=CAMNT_0013007377 /DNA_START=117 /DNA_END=1397 /DNA_ORIENTATION=-